MNQSEAPMTKADYEARWFAIERSTDRIDRALCLERLPGIYTLLNLPYPGNDNVHFVQSPDAALKLINELSGTKDTWYEPFVSSYEVKFFAEQDEKNNERLRPLLDFAMVSGWCWVSDGCVVICDRPVEIVTQPGNVERFHRDGAPCILYADGWGTYALNHTIMPKEVVVTPANKLDPALFESLTNAQQRAEFVKKIGVARLAEHYGLKVIDAKDGYELVTLALPDRGDRPFLKMTNPSVAGMIHIEGVPPGTTTVDAARAWRNSLGDFVAPLALS